MYLKPNLTFIRISTVQDANELILFLIPELNNHQFIDVDFPLSDMMILMQYQMSHLRNGNLITARQIWNNALNSCDGIYYENSGDLHFHTIFHTWDCSSIMLFDPRNASITRQ